MVQPGFTDHCRHTLVVLGTAGASSHPSFPAVLYATLQNARTVDLCYEEWGSFSLSPSNIQKCTQKKKKKKGRAAETHVQIPMQIHGLCE